PRANSSSIQKLRLAIAFLDWRVDSGSALDTKSPAVAVMPESRSSTRRPRYITCRSTTRRAFWRVSGCGGSISSGKRITHHRAIRNPIESPCRRRSRASRTELHQLVDARGANAHHRVGRTPVQFDAPIRLRDGAAREHYVRHVAGHFPRIFGLEDPVV